ncbi:uridine kinase [Arcanobacterium ihumii]|uniref:uridine kinase n=1 Tax=Arcanobacterium ihumii TaxID=2138162 RepID=UPI000F526153|nr:uridine kinase [Arcanobacterium ihumii]
MVKPFVIGIAGGTGSGKTTLTQAIAERFDSKTTVVYHDNYYKSHTGLTYEQRSKLNFDSLDAFDNDFMAAQLRDLIAGNAIDSPIYDFADHNRSANTMRIEPAPVILVEGILIFAEPQLCDLFDLKLFVDTDADVRILRRIKRDVLERGRDINSVELQYLATVKPMHELYVEPSKRHADLIIPEGGHNLVALDILFHRIEHLVSTR